MNGSSRAIGYMVLGILGFTLMDATAKFLVQFYPAWQIVWVRYIGQVVLVAAFLNRNLFQALRTKHPKVQALRSLFQFGSTAFFFAGLAYIGLAEATAIADTNPVLITLGAALFLGERLGPRRIAGVAAAMVGALIVIRPGGDLFQPAALLPVGCAVCYAAHALATRWLGQSERGATSMLYSSLFGTIVTTATLPMWIEPVAWVHLPAFAAIALLGTFAQLFILRAFTTGEASAIAPFGYLGIVFATIWGMTLFGEYPDGWTILGALVIVGAGLYVWHRERQVR